MHTKGLNKSKKKLPPIQIEYALCSISGILLTLCAYFSCLWWLVFFALIPFSYSFLKPNTNNVFRKILFFCIPYYLPQLFWIYSLSSVVPMNKLSSFIVLTFAQLSVVMLQSLYMWIALFFLNKVKKGNYADVVFLSLLYVFGEWMQENTFILAFPWFELGNYTTRFTAFIQSASIFGGLGISLLIIFINASLAFTLIYIKDKKKMALSILALSVVFMGNLIFGIKRIEKVEKATDTLTVGVVSENYLGVEKWKKGTVDMLQAFLDLSKEAVQGGAKIIVWPETAIPITLNETSKQVDKIVKFCMENRTNILVGGFYTNDIEELFNATLYFDEYGNVSEPYCKQILVPFGETFPFGDLIGKVIPKFSDMIGIASELTKAEKSSIINSDFGKIGVMICYESIFSSSVRNCLSLQSGLIVVPTNDSWLSNEYAMRKHFEHSVIRAVESNRFLLRSANSGISSIISPKGKTISKIPPFTSSYILGDVSFIYKRTLYSIWGDIIVIPALIIIIISVLNKVKRYFNKRISNLNSN